jgi:Kef-type K+ transport system membrane component KefB
MDFLHQTIVYLIAALIAVPLTKRFGFGSVLGYLAAGIIIGPYGFGFVRDAEHILHFGELGVVFLLFIIGLELQPSRLWVLRRMVFGLGTAQVLLSAAVLALIAMSFGQSVQGSVIIGLILALSSTAFVLQLLAERKQLTTTYTGTFFFYELEQSSQHFQDIVEKTGRFIFQHSTQHNPNRGQIDELTLEFGEEES